jgi:tripartite motif-containing protein 71
MLPFGALISDLHRTVLHSRNRSCFWLIPLLFLPAVLGCSRAHSQAAVAAKPAPIEFVQQWGVRGTEPGQLESPVGLAADAIGRVYFADRATGFVQKFEASGIPLLCFETPVVRFAAAIAVDSGGAIYVVNPRAGLIQIFFPQGDSLRGLRIAPQRAYEGPFTFSIDAGGRIYVPDPSGGRVQVFNSHGVLLKIWRILPHASEKAARPFAAVAASDAVYVGDAEANRILKFAPDGVQTAEFKLPDADASRLLALAAVNKHVFALTGFPVRLQVWSEDGHLELTDTMGDRLSAVESAAYLAADTAGDLMVLDPEARRVLRFRAHLDLL